MKNEEKFNEVYYFAFYFCNKTLAKSNLEKEEFVLFYRLQFIIQGKLQSELKAGTEADIMEE